MTIFSEINALNTVRTLRPSNFNNSAAISILKISRFERERRRARTRFDTNKTTRKTINKSVYRRVKPATLVRPPSRFSVRRVNSKTPFSNCRNFAGPTRDGRPLPAFESRATFRLFERFFSVFDAKFDGILDSIRIYRLSELKVAFFLYFHKKLMDLGLNLFEVKIQVMQSVDDCDYVLQVWDYKIRLFSMHMFKL